MVSDRPGGRPPDRPLTRRTVCKVLGAAALAWPATGEAVAQESFPPAGATDWGRPTTLGDGVVATFVTRDGGGGPEYVGVWFTADALTGLPTGPEDHYETPLALPPATTEARTPFEWVGVDWNPEGHAPADVYDVPHFDFHFYLQARDRVLEAIPPGECDRDDDGTPDVEVSCDVYERAIEPVPDTQRPPGFVSTGDVVPHMGNHLVDEGAAEFEGEPFTHTMVWGSFGGRITFAEPMVARDYLASLESTATAPTSLPNTAPEAGYYPSQYAVRYLPDQDAYAVTLERFERLPATTS